MSSSYSARVALRVFIAGILCCGVSLSATTASAQTKMATFDSAGETSFALSVKADFQNQPSRPTDVVIYVDTSASQTGVFREDSITVLEKMLANLSADDRVKLLAVDLDPVPLIDRFVPANSRELSDAIDRLRQRTPLGSTDMKQMLKSAPAEFESEATRNKNIVYIGDGISRGGIVHPSVLDQVVSRLVRHHISVSSFAIGPDRNMELLAVLANHTGGNLLIDNDMPGSVEAAARALVSTVHGSVFWPESPEFSDGVIETYPTAFPPLREDRDSIVLGTLAGSSDVQLKLSGKTNARSDSMTFTARPEASNSMYSFLPRMLRDARKDRGLMMPTAGSSGLLEYARVLGFKSRAISQLGKQAMANGDLLAAQRLAAAAMVIDPMNRSAQVVAKNASFAPAKQEGNPFGGDGGEDLFGSDAAETPAAEAPTPESPAEDLFGGSDAAEPAAADMVEEPSPFDETDADTDSGPNALFEDGDAAPSEGPIVQPPSEERSVVEPPTVVPVQPEAVPSNDGGFNLIGPPVTDGSALNRLMAEEEATANRMILNEEQERQIINDKIRKQVSFELKQARQELRTQPGAAIERLKSMIGVLDNTVDLFPNTRQDLRNRLESALLSSRQQKLDFDERQTQLRQAQATALARERELAAMDRREEQLARLINRFNSLMDEGNYDAAQEVTRTAVDLAPRSPEAIVAAATAERAAAAAQYQQLREEKQRNFAAALFEVRRASIPFPANPLMQFPPAEEWQRKKLRRAKYQSIRLTGSENDEKILRALEQPATLDYEDEAWSDIEADLEEKFKINIVLTQSAKDDSLDVDEPVTVNLRGIRLKNALRLMLKEKNATFIVRDEVLQIISLEDAEDPKYLVTNVYNVGDLVAPRFNPGGGFGGGIGGGGGGGGFGGGGGGLGGGGGGGLGGGGGGGVFCIQESGLTLVHNRGKIVDSNTTEPSPGTAVNATAPKAKVLTLPITTSEGTADSWSEYFSNVYADAGSVRLTVREMMKQQKSDEIVALIFAAIENNQRHDWMYEALTLTLQIAGRPKTDVERALMSAVDLSSDVNDAMYAAQYMATHGMEKRAIGLFEDIARAYPTRTEPVLMGLRAANRIDDADGVRWATLGVLAHEWPDHPEVVDEARHSANALRLKMQEAGDTEALAAYEAELIAAKQRDCFVKVSWTGDADLDIYVQEPGGTICSRLKKRTRSGGVMMGDQSASAADESGETAEYYVLPKGFSGDYKLFVKRILGEVTSGKVTVAIYSHYGSDQQVSEVRQLDLNGPGFAVEFALADGRRTESLEAHTIASVVDEQVTSNRNILAQQIASASAAGLGSSLGSGNADLRDFNNLLFNRRRQGVVGYQPEITTIPLGPFMQVNHATTADRLYVLVSVTPQFTELIDVFTFNSAGDADGATGNPGAGN